MEGYGLLGVGLAMGWEHNRLDAGTPINSDMPREAETSGGDSTRLGSASLL